MFVRESRVFQTNDVCQNVYRSDVRRAKKKKTMIGGRTTSNIVLIEITLYVLQMRMVMPVGADNRYDRALRSV